MGATTFFETCEASSAEVAFRTLVEEDRRYYGNNPYSGSIATKPRFVPMGVASNVEQARKMADLFIDKNDHRIEDKWGPAGCIEVALAPCRKAFCFFGWAAE